MKTTITTTDRRSVFTLAWQYVKNLGFTMSEALKTAWADLKVRNALRKGIAHFRFRKVDGSIREAWGTLEPSRTPATGDRGHAPSVQPFYDTEKGAWRCYKKSNIIGLA